MDVNTRTDISIDAAGADGSSGPSAAAPSAPSAFSAPSALPDLPPGAAAPSEPEPTPEQPAQQPLSRIARAGGLLRGLLRGRRRQRRGFRLLCLLTVLGFVPITVVHLAGNQYVRSIRTVPAEPVGLVFGAQVVGDVPSPFLASRLDLAIALWRAGKIRVFLVTGARTGPDYDEPKAMRDYLVRHGVPAPLIVQDGAGYDTWESCIRAQQVYGVRHAIVITQSFHVARAAFLCHAAGIAAYGVGDGLSAWYVSRQEFLHDSAREIAAAFNAVYQGSLKPAPTVSGPPSDAVDRALRAASQIG